MPNCSFFRANTLEILLSYTKPLHWSCWQVLWCAKFIRKSRVMLYRTCFSSQGEMVETLINTVKSRQNDCHFPDDIFKCIFWKKNVLNLIKISLKYISKGPIDNIPALVQIMAWRRPGAKPLSEPMMARLSVHICITLSQWVKTNLSSYWNFVSWQVKFISICLVMSFVTLPRDMAASLIMLVKPIENELSPHHWLSI